MQEKRLNRTKGIKALGDSKRVEAAAVVEFIKLISPDVDLEHTKQLELRKKGIQILPLKLSALFNQVCKLDLSHNKISDVSPLSTLPYLSNLNLSNNSELCSLNGLKSKKLVVLSVAYCKLCSLSGLEDSFETLRTFIANDNELQLQSACDFEKGECRKHHPISNKEASIVSTAIDNYRILASLKALETVVLSRNPQLCSLYPYDNEEIKDKESSKLNEKLDGGNKCVQNDDNTHDSREESNGNCACLRTYPLTVFEELTHLKKLSLSECNLTMLPKRWFLPLVTELRLAHNALTSMQPDGVILRSIKILDISYNKLDSIATLRRCLFLRQINLKGNPLIYVYAQRDQREHGENAESVSIAMTESRTTSGHDKTRSVPRSLQRSLRKMLKYIELIDGQPVPSLEELSLKRSKPVKSVFCSNESETVMNKTDAQRPFLEAAVPPSKKQRSEGFPENNQSDAKNISKELDEKDVLLDIPDAEVHAPIVRREKIHKVHHTGLIESGGAAVAALLKRSDQTISW